MCFEHGSDRMCNPRKESQAKPKQSKFPACPQTSAFQSTKTKNKKQDRNKSKRKPHGVFLSVMFLPLEKYGKEAAKRGGLQQRFCFLLECEWRILLGSLVP